MATMVPRKPTPQQVKQWNTPTVPELTEKEKVKEEEGKAKVQETTDVVCVKKEEEDKKEEGEVKVQETADVVRVKKEEEGGETKAQKAGIKLPVPEESKVRPLSLSQMYSLCHLPPLPLKDPADSTLTRRPLRRSGRGERVDYSKMMESATESESGEDTLDQTVPS